MNRKFKYSLSLLGFDKNDQEPRRHVLRQKKMTKNILNFKLNKDRLEILEDILDFPSIIKYTFIIPYFLIGQNTIVYSFEIGDQANFKPVPLEGIYFNFDYNQNIVLAHDKELDAYLIQTILTDENYQEKGQMVRWYFAEDFPSEKQISDLLENCQKLGWEKKKMSFNAGIGPPPFGFTIIEEKEICVTTKQVFLANPLGLAEKYYYGLLNIFGLAGVKRSDPQGFLFFQTFMEVVEINN
jgi:hypothetical protein